MRKRIIKGVAAVLCLMLIAAGGYRVYDVNSRYHLETKVYTVGESLDFKDYTITNLGGAAYTVSEFNEIYGMEISSDSPYLVCLKVGIEHELPADPDMQKELENIASLFTTNGFRTDTWSSGLDPFLFADINFTEAFVSEYQETGKGELVLVGSINQDNMRADHYKRYKQQQYSYVLDIYPTNIRLLVQKEDGK